jgi:MoaA/NifB/PqqE/SkfB family radical SAM enzyme
VSYRFANILFSGPCNLRCPYCIGEQVPKRPANLDVFPLRGLDRFVDALRRADTRQVSLTGTDTDPLLYRHPEALVRHLRTALPGVQLSLHTNGVLVLERLDVVHLFDRVCVSLPSFRRQTFHAMTGRSQPLDFAAICERVEIPLKVSTTVTRDNLDEVDEIIARCAQLGVRRLSLRRLFNSERLPILEDETPVARFGGNPVYRRHDVEVTVWDFDSSELECLNLFSDGSLSGDYLLSLAPASTSGRRQRNRRAQRDQKGAGDDRPASLRPARA